MTRRRAGIVLVDGIVAGVLLGIGLAVILGLSGAALSAQQQGENLANAAMLADDRLSMVVALGPEGYGETEDLRGRFAPPFEEYQYELVIEPGEPGDPNFVSVTVSWGERTRDRVIIETLVAPRLGEDPDPDREPEATVDRDGE